MRINLRLEDVAEYLREHHRLHFNPLRPSWRGLTLTKSVVNSERPDVQMSIYQSRGGCFTAILESVPGGSEVTVEVLPFGDPRINELLSRALF